jgi:DNA polymerase III delta' subunit
MPAKTGSFPSHPLLLAHLKGERVAHTYLFSGPEGASKNELALGFAKSLLCLKGEFFQACVCPSCSKIDRKNHPDVRWFGEDEKARSLKIEMVREILHHASLKPYEGLWKVFVLEGAERLTGEASNALLKTLEEPPGHSVFILLAENKAHLLETIQSRAFEIRALPAPEKDPLEDAEIQVLNERGWPAFFEAIKSFSRQELAGLLDSLLLYLRNRSISEWEYSEDRSRRYLKALEAVYETQKALDSNVNPKLAMTVLEISIGKAFKG